MYSSAFWNLNIDKRIIRKPGDVTIKKTIIRLSNFIINAQNLYRN